MHLEVLGSLAILLFGSDSEMRPATLEVGATCKQILSRSAEREYGPFLTDPEPPYSKKVTVGRMTLGRTVRVDYHCDAEDRVVDQSWLGLARNEADAIEFYLQTKRALIAGLGEPCHDAETLLDGPDDDASESADGFPRYTTIWKLEGFRMVHSITQPGPEVPEWLVGFRVWPDSPAADGPAASEAAETAECSNPRLETRTKE